MPGFGRRDEMEKENLKEPTEEIRRDAEAEKAETKEAEIQAQVMKDSRLPQVTIPHGALTMYPINSETWLYTREMYTNVLMFIIRI